MSTPATSEEIYGADTDEAVNAAGQRDQESGHADGLAALADTANRPARFTADTLPVGKWICLADMDDNFGKFVKVVGLEDGRAYLQDEDGMDRWGGKIRGEVYDESLPIYGWLQS